jgi:ABC-type lipoprotein release transport system permease subunit
VFQGLPPQAVVFAHEAALRLHAQVVTMGNLQRRRDGPEAAAPARELTMASVLLADARPEQIAAVRAAISERGFRTHHIYDALAMIKAFFLVVNLLVGALGAIALAVALLQIINTMSMAILERTREIGVMKAIGARDRDIRRLFLAESALIGLVGAAVGIIGAWCGGRIVEAIASIVLRKTLNELTIELGTLFAIPWWLAGGALAFALTVSWLAACVPALRAARIQPAIALRRE